ncbi:MAG: hypothetical protein OXF73_03985 [Gammaproteobacteria bacterium]|nr:hypothetical protein [Gammaproteobacteria bacterium]MCY4227469.1 hypothetical protein [Gammaproteobacteria bacterium]
MSNSSHKNTKLGQSVEISKLKKKISGLNKKIESFKEQFSEVRQSDCFILALGPDNLANPLVDQIYNELKNSGFKGNKLDVIIDSGGGSIGAAYNLAQLFRRYGKERLSFVIPRWAKSAATLLIWELHLLKNLA